MIEEFIQYVQHHPEADKRGGNKKCFIKGSYALLAGSFKPAEIEQTIELEQKLAGQGIPVVPTLEYKITGSKDPMGYFKGFILQSKAPGEELYASNKISSEEYGKRLTELASRPQEFYDRFASDWLAIEKAGLMIDPSKSANFFYTPERIHFIDLTPQKRNELTETSFYEASVVLFNGGMYYKKDYNTKDFRQKQTSILNKTILAFAKQGADKQKMSEIVNKHFPDIATQNTNQQNLISKFSDYSR
jgi:hypothetical protein